MPINYPEESTTLYFPLTLHHFSPRSFSLFALPSTPYLVYPVNPRDSTCYATLSSLPSPPDAVNLIISPKIGVSIIDEMITLNVGHVFIQPGAGTTEIRGKAKGSGIEVEEGCVLVTPDAEFQSML